MYVVVDASADHSSTRHLDNALLNSNTNIVGSLMDRPVQTTAIGNGEGGTHELRPSEDNLPSGINLGSSAQITPSQLETFGISSSSHRSISLAEANCLVQATDSMIKPVNGVAGIGNSFMVAKICLQAIMADWANSPVNSSQIAQTTRAFLMYHKLSRGFRVIPVMMTRRRLCAMPTS